MMDREEWEKKKAELQAQQHKVNGRMLRRVYDTKHGKTVIDTSDWPTTDDVLRRIAYFIDEKRYTATKVRRKLEGGDKITTKYGAVYSLITKQH
jgi:hypothetical protein